MLILGLQKLTLLDYPGRTAATVFTGGCNFRCPFCHNAPLVLQPDSQGVCDEDEVLAFLKKRRGLLDGVCVSGGEPTLQHDLPAFLQKVRELGYAVKLDTNGSRPDMLRQVMKRRLVDYVAMDIKSSPEGYARACGLTAEPVSIRESIDLLLTGSVDYEFRTTVVRQLHDRKTIARAAQSISGAKRYFLQAFVDSGAVIQSGYDAVSRDEMYAFLEEARLFVPNTRLRGVE